MPANLPREWYEVEKKYLEARTFEEKIEWLKKLISVTPKHKGTENLIAELRKRLAKLRKEAERKKIATKKPKFVIKKKGAAQVCIIGFPNSGKSSLLKNLTNAKVEIAAYPFTTKEPKVGMLFYEKVPIQLIEIPATFTKEFNFLLKNCDLVIALLDAKENLAEQETFILNYLKENKIPLTKVIFLISKDDEGKFENGFSNLNNSFKKVPNLIWKKLGLIKVYAKEPRKKASEVPIALKKGSKVEDFIEEINENMLKTFKFARVFEGNLIKKVGLDYELKDGSIVEIHC